MKNVLVFGFFLLALNVFSQSSLSGKVTDLQTGEEIKGATVKVFKSNSAEVVDGGFSDFVGDFKLPMKPGTYDVEVSAPGYHSKRIDAVEVFICKTKLQEIKLEVNDIKS